MHALSTVRFYISMKDSRWWEMCTTANDESVTVLLPEEKEEEKKEENKDWK